MRYRLELIVSMLLLTPLASACDRAEPEVTAGVSAQLAAERARLISNVAYDMRFRVPRERDAAVEGEAVIEFELAEAGEPVVLDFARPDSSIRSLEVMGEPVEYQLSNGHIVLPGSALRRGPNSVRIEFLAGDDALNRGRDYLYTLFVPDRASTAFPGFDQPDMKARYALTLDVPAGWRAVANGTEQSSEEAGGRTVYRFAKTEPISTYLFSFAAGRFEVERAERAGRIMRMFHRETDADRVARNREEIFDLHAASLEWLEEYTGIPYPFEKFDFVLVPSFQYGGMEHPGSIFYRASSLLLEESATQGQQLGRASLIAHETAHMWFGNLVTMRWFNDVWTKEVFANFMAAKIVNPSFPDIDHDLRFVMAHHPSAYGVDRTGGANPIRQKLENLNEAGSLYGAIIYQKAPIVMRQLEAIVGEEEFREGIREYLGRYSFANATWPDLIDILDRRSSEELKSWSRVWVQEVGRPRVATRLDVDDDGRIASLDLVTSDPGERGREWPQRVDVALGYPDSIVMVPAYVNGRTVDVSEAEGMPAPDWILPDGGGLGYAGFELDDDSREALLEDLSRVADDRVRGVAWIILFEDMLAGGSSPATLIETGMRALESERTELIVQRISADVRTLYWRFLRAGERDELAPRLESLFWQLMETAEQPTLKATYFNAYRSVALTPASLRRLRAVWNGDRSIDGLPLSERDFTALAQLLALHGTPDAKRILDRQYEAITNPDRKDQFAFVRPALSADPAVRDSVFRSLADPRNRHREPWALAALRYLNHPLRQDHARRYVRPGLELLEEVRTTGDIFFPKRWLDALLSGHSSVQAAATVRTFLHENPDYPERLRDIILQSADGLFRAAGVLHDPS